MYIPNLTVLTHASVNKVILDKKRATGVEIEYGGKIRHINARVEVVLSLGAIHTPKVLMLSGIGDQAEIQRLGIPVVQHLPGVGENFQDHFAIGCVWEYEEPLAPRNNGGEATFFWKSDSRLDTPDLQTCQAEVPLCSAETVAKFNPPHGSWTLFGGVVRPKSRDQTNAEDLVQEPCLRAIGGMGRLRPDSNVKSWLFTILRNIWLNQVRQWNTMPQVVELDLDGSDGNGVPSTSNDPHANYISK